MLNFENILKYNLSRIKVVHSLPGRVRIKVNNLNSVPDKYRKYDEEISRGMKILDGIDDVSINYVLGTILISYDTNKLYEKKVLSWVKEFAYICIDNSNNFKKYFEANFNYVINTIEHQLKDAVKNYN